MNGFVVCENLFSWSRRGCLSIYWLRLSAGRRPFLICVAKIMDLRLKESCSGLPAAQGIGAKRLCAVACCEARISGDRWTLMSECGRAKLQLSWRTRRVKSGLIVAESLRCRTCGKRVVALNHPRTWVRLEWRWWKQCGPANLRRRARAWHN